MNRRLAIARHWLAGRSNVTLSDLCAKLCARTCTARAKPLIESLRVDDGWYEVRLKTASFPLFFPARMPLHPLYQCIAEVGYPDDWHYYEAAGTRVEAGDTVLDCGAAEGLFTLGVAPRCARVYAIEPLPDFVAALRRTFARQANVEVVPVALGASPGTAHLNEHNIMSRISDEGTARIDVDTIDHRFLERGIAVNYIKADLEGGEIDMLRGAERTIRTCQPRIAITTYHAASHAEEIAGLLHQWNPAYRFRTKGIEERAGAPVMLHAW